VWSGQLDIDFVLQVFTIGQAHAVEGVALGSGLISFSGATAARSAAAGGRLLGRARGLSCRHRLTRLAHGFSGNLQLDAMAVVYEAVEDGIGQRRLTQIRMPGVDRELTGDERGAGVDAVIEDFKQVGAILRGQRRQTPVVDLCGATHNWTYVQQTDMWSL
jgi:hypothetical protein